MMHRRDDPRPAPLPAWASPLWRLAYLAVGDDRSATVLVADVLQHAPAHEGAAVKLLVDRLPEGWLSWPGAAGPGEWLRLKLRREQADRLLSVLGEWSAPERLALGLHLLWDVPRDDLDKWVGKPGIGAAVAELIVHVADSLDWVDSPSDHPACVPFRSDLLDAHEPHVPRALRMHLLACDACRTHAAGLRRSTALVRHAVDVFFRQPPPIDLLQRAAKHPRIQRSVHVPPALVPLLVAGLVLAALVLRPHHESSAAASAQGPILSAADVLDRALDRFAQAPADGVFHEQVRAVSNAHAVVIDRWFDRFKRVRITVHTANNEPIFELSSDGTRTISYRIADRDGDNHDALIEPPDVPALLPILRQLPFVGSFGSMVAVDQSTLDVPLLAQAQRGTPALLGTRRWHDRTGYLINSAQDDGTQLMLLIDTQQFNLLRAQRVHGDAATAQTVWQAQVVETSAGAPAGTFDPVSKRTIQRFVDPRQLADVITPAALADFTEHMPVPIPTVLPEPVVTQYLRTLGDASMGVLQVYEGPWSTVAIVTQRTHYEFRPSGALPNTFAHGQYAVLETTLPQSTFITFSYADNSNDRSTIYYWHALASPAQRERALVDLLNSIVIVDEANAAQYAERFAAPPLSTSAVGNQMPDARAQGTTPQPQRRYLRSKLIQTSR